jgi:hypothetical protein
MTDYIVTDRNDNTILKMVAEYDNPNGLYLYFDFDEDEEGNDQFTINFINNSQYEEYEGGMYFNVYNTDVVFITENAYHPGLGTIGFSSYNAPIFKKIIPYKCVKAIEYICKIMSQRRDLPTQEQLNAYINSNTHNTNNTNNTNNNNQNTINLNTKNIPAGSTNSVMMNEIQNGNIMTNFQNEFSHGRYYKKSTYNQLPQPKKNPFSRERITSKTNYKAKIVGEAQEGGRKTRHRKQSMRKTRKVKKVSRI